MSDFFKRFLREDPRKLSPPGNRALFLGAFGKHPGWDDHIEEDQRTPDLGLRTESLHLAKSLLYVQGIGRNIDAGGWERLEPAQRLPGFNHAFLWQADAQFLAGRLWASRDGKGRTHYPMITAVHALGASLDWVLDTVPPCLEGLRQSCGAATSAGEVAARLDSARAELRGELSRAPTTDPPDGGRMQRFIQHPQLGPGHTGLLRVLYQLQRQAAAYAVGHYSPRGNLSALRAQDLRVPAAGSAPGEVFGLWTRLLHTRIDRAAPLLMLWPVGAEWLDLILGEPIPEQLFCLLATPAKLPCVSDVPFNLDAAFVTQAQASLEALTRGAPPPSGGSMVTRFLGSLFK